MPFCPSVPDVSLVASNCRESGRVSGLRLIDWAVRGREKRKARISMIESVSL